MKSKYRTSFEAMLGRNISAVVDGTKFVEIDGIIKVRCTCARTFVVHQSQLHKPIKCYKCGNGERRVFSSDSYRQDRICYKKSCRLFGG